MWEEGSDTVKRQMEFKILRASTETARWNGTNKYEDFVLGKLKLFIRSVRFGKCYTMEMI